MKWTASLLDGNDSVKKLFPIREPFSSNSFTLITYRPYRSLYSRTHTNPHNSLEIEWYVDVEDDARIHVIALLDPDVKSERLFAFAAPFNWTDIISVLRKLRPRNTKIPDPPENEPRDLSDIVPSKRAEKLLESFFGQSGWIGFEESLEAGIDSLGY